MQPWTYNMSVNHHMHVPEALHISHTHAHIQINTYIIIIVITQLSFFVIIKLYSICCHSTGAIAHTPIFKDRATSIDTSM